ncbi:MAG TPA: phosphoglycerate dehydrogenase [Acidimicrobiales bacterium]|nr:phosphoglycerate dehydrogenase [Acidimicrobiales bacterium]
MTEPSCKVLLLENIHADATSVLKSAGFDVDCLDHAMGEDELVERIGDVDLLGIRSGTHVTERVLAAAPRLVSVGAFCIGTNQIDLAAATRRGVAVFNAPFSNTRSVVELALAEVIALTRRLTDRNAQMHAGVWDKSASGSHEVRGRRLGIVGYGNIGTQLSVLAENLGMSVLFYDTADRLALGNARRCGSLEELLECADVVTLHVDGRPDNQQMFGEEQFARMRPGSIFLNLSRGFVVDHAALRRHLESGHLVGAAVDVFPNEPRRKGEPFQSELRGLGNVILTPHVGGSTEEAQQDIGNFVANKLRQFVRTGNSALSVNFPGLEPTERAALHRLMHVHANVPGVMAEVNAILARHGLNVESQHLGTRDQLGYAILDIASEFSDEVVHELERVDGTRRVRVLR